MYICTYIYVSLSLALSLSLAKKKINMAHRSFSIKCHSFKYMHTNIYMHIHTYLFHLAIFICTNTYSHFQAGPSIATRLIRKTSSYIYIYIYIHRW